MLHRWKDAPDEVGFLKDFHRHIFYVDAWIEQKDEGRDIEYIQAKRGLEKYLKMTFSPDINYDFSCERVAIEIKGVLEGWYEGKKVKVFVSEDNENGCLVE